MQAGRDGDHRDRDNDDLSHWRPRRLADPGEISTALLSPLTTRHLRRVKMVHESTLSRFPVSQKGLRFPVLDPALTLLTADCCTARGSSGLDVGRLTQATFAQRKLWNIERGFPGSPWLNARKFDHLGPLLGLFGDEFSEFSGCHRHRLTA